MNTKNLLLILAGVAVVVAAGVGLYLSKTRVQEQATSQQREVGQIESQSQSDDVDSIEKDLNDTNVDNVDQETVQIQSELNASY